MLSRCHFFLTQPIDAVHIQGKHPEISLKISNTNLKFPGNVKRPRKDNVEREQSQQTDCPNSRVPT
jgi:hypothetical protein